jgi:transcriptional regulator with XRE-family HTH domain
MSTTVIPQPLVLGQAIKAARKGKGLTQVALAESLGTYPRAIIELERGRSTADLKFVLNVLARVGLQLSVEQK